MSSVTTGAAITDFAVTQDGKAVTSSAITTTGSAVTLTVATVEPSDVDQNIVYSVSYKGGAAKTTTLLVPKKVVVDATVTTASAITIADVTLGSLAVLPANVTVSLSNNTTTSAAITWNDAAKAPATYATVGPVVINGVLAGYNNYPVSANVNVIAAVSKVQFVGTPLANYTLGNLRVTVKDQNLVKEVLVNGVAVTGLKPFENVYTIPVKDATYKVEFVDLDGIKIVAQEGVEATLTASSREFDSLLYFLKVTVNDSSLVKTVTLGGVDYVVGAAAGANGYKASVVDATHIKVTGLTANPTTVVLVSFGGKSVTV